MFETELNEANSSILVKHVDNNNDLIVVANGKFTFDKPDLSLLIVITDLTISSNDTDLLGLFISDVMSYMGRHYEARVFLRLPMFDNQLNINNLKLENQAPTGMVVKIDEIYCDDIILYDKEQYEFIIDKQLILKYCQELTNLLNTNAYWVQNKVNYENMTNRIETAKRVVMVFDKINQIPCGFGRIHMMDENYQVKDTMGYVDDVVVDSHYQRKGLGGAITNYLMGIKNERINGILCMACVDEGVGAIAAPKLYKKAGFKLISDINDRIAIFVSEEFFALAHHS